MWDYGRPDPRDAQHSACRASLQIEFNGYEVHKLCTITAPPPALVPVPSVFFENLNALLVKSIAHKKGLTAVAKSHRRESSESVALTGSCSRHNGASRKA